MDDITKLQNSKEFQKKDVVKSESNMPETSYEREWCECDNCNAEGFTKKECKKFLKLCPKCQEQPSPSYCFSEEDVELELAKYLAIEYMEGIECASNSTTKEKEFFWNNKITDDTKLGSLHSAKQILKFLWRT